MFTLITTAPDGTVTRSQPLRRGPDVICAVADTLNSAAPWLSEAETRHLGLCVVRNALGITSVHTETGYRFRVDLATPATV